MGKLRQLIGRLASAVRYFRAVQMLDDRTKLPEALKLVERMAPGMPKHIEVLVYLLKSTALIEQKNLRSAHDHLLKAFREAPDIQRVFSKDDVEYVRAYAAKWGLLVADELGEDADPFELDYDKIDLKGVRRHLIRYYPLSKHPQWSNSGDST